jgi:hypothetical protein
MVRIGVTGHMNLTAATALAVAEELRAHLATLGGDGELVGVSCIARGADSLFADAVLAAGGTLEVVLPSRDYRAEKVAPDDAERFDRLLKLAVRVHRMDYERAGREAYAAANEAMLNTVDTLVAVWDNRPAAGLGGTADVVERARGRGLPVTVIWPAGAAREG